MGLFLPAEKMDMEVTVNFSNSSPEPPENNIELTTSTSSSLSKPVKRKLGDMESSSFSRVDNSIDDAADSALLPAAKKQKCTVAVIGGDDVVVIADRSSADDSISPELVAAAAALSAASCEKQHATATVQFTVEMNTPSISECTTVTSTDSPKEPTVETRPPKELDTETKTEMKTMPKSDYGTAEIEANAEIDKVKGSKKLIKVNIGKHHEAVIVSNVSSVHRSEGITDLSEATPLLLKRVPVAATNGRQTDVMTVSGKQIAPKKEHSCEQTRVGALDETKEASDGRVVAAAVIDKKMSEDPKTEKRTETQIAQSTTVGNSADDAKQQQVSDEKIDVLSKNTESAKRRLQRSSSPVPSDKESITVDSSAAVKVKPIDADFGSCNSQKRSTESTSRFTTTGSSAKGRPSRDRSSEKSASKSSKSDGRRTNSSRRSQSGSKRTPSKRSRSRSRSTRRSATTRSSAKSKSKSSRSRSGSKASKPKKRGKGKHEDRRRRMEHNRLTTDSGRGYVESQVKWKEREDDRFKARERQREQGRGGRDRDGRRPEGEERKRDDRNESGKADMDLRRNYRGEGKRAAAAATEDTAAGRRRARDSGSADGKRVVESGGRGGKGLDPRDADLRGDGPMGNNRKRRRRGGRKAREKRERMKMRDERRRREHQWRESRRTDSYAGYKSRPERSQASAPSSRPQPDFVEDKASATASRAEDAAAVGRGQVGHGRGAEGGRRGGEVRAAATGRNNERMKDRRADRINDVRRGGDEKRTSAGSSKLKTVVSVTTKSGRISLPPASKSGSASASSSFFVHPERLKHVSTSPPPPAHAYAQRREDVAVSKKKKKTVVDLRRLREESSSRRSHSRSRSRGRRQEHTRERKDGHSHSSREDASRRQRRHGDKRNWRRERSLERRSTRRSRDGDSHRRRASSGSRSRDRGRKRRDQDEEDRDRRRDRRPAAEDLRSKDEKTSTFSSGKKIAEKSKGFQEDFEVESRRELKLTSPRSEAGATRTSQWPSPPSQPLETEDSDLEEMGKGKGGGKSRRRRRKKQKDSGASDDFGEQRKYDAIIYDFVSHKFKKNKDKFESREDYHTSIMRCSKRAVCKFEERVDGGDSQASGKAKEFLHKHREYLSKLVAKYCDKFGGA